MRRREGKWRAREAVAAPVKEEVEGRDDEERAGRKAAPRGAGTCSEEETWTRTVSTQGAARAG